MGNAYGATATLTGCTISGNSAKYGGGLANGLGGTITLTDCTISGNSAVAGGGIATGVDGGTATLNACTISANIASAYGGGLGNLGTVTLTDTIVAGNTLASGGASDIGGASASAVTGTYNLIGTGGSGGIVNGSQSNIVLTSLTDLSLAPLGNYGGPTETMALLPGSPAIGTARPSAASRPTSAVSPWTPPQISALFKAKSAPHQATR